MTDDTIRFDAAETTLILSCAVGQPPSVLYWGARLAATVTAREIAQLTARFGGPGGADAYIADSLALEPGLGLLGPSGLSAHRDGRDWASLFTVVGVDADDGGATIRCSDQFTRLALEYVLRVDPGTGIATVASELINNGDAALDVIEMATACLALPSAMTELIGFTGRWAGEFQRERLARFSGGYVRENRRGRMSHDSFPAVVLCAADTTEATGHAYGLHLAWSGNHRVRVDTLSDGRVFASLGALLLPGEVRLAPGERYRSPAIVMGFAAAGLSALSRAFHAHVRDRLLTPAMRAKPRPVHYNTWEAVYFDHEGARLRELATRAAALGVERFVLDDGWFGARRHDRAGLGDWTVSADAHPDGLKPLIDHVTGLGMEMGLWIEPEMVNPDSELYRAHPDWVLGVQGVEQVPFRNQLVLDIARPEVAEHLFTQIDALLGDHAIGYVKWDMNRDLNHPGGSGGRARAHAQVDALYALLARVRAAHPQVEIESCASGGGRADYGVLAHTDRVWTSDSNDALDRQDIQRGASMFLPLDVMGAHVGPRRCHITGRSLSMGMRVGTALMGHMGLELNLLSEPAAELDELGAGIALYKRHRALLHGGDFHRLDTARTMNVVGVVARDRTAALFSVAYLTGHPTTLPGRQPLAGLDADRSYRIRLVWPTRWRSRSARAADALDLTAAGTVLAGDALMKVGLQLPLTEPETVLLLHLTAEPA